MYGGLHVLLQMHPCCRKGESWKAGQRRFLFGWKIIAIAATPALAPALLDSVHICKSEFLPGLMYIKPLKTSWTELRVFCVSYHHSPQCLEEKDYLVLQLTLAWTIRRAAIFLSFWSLKAKFPSTKELNWNNKIANKGNINWIIAHDFRLAQDFLLFVKFFPRRRFFLLFNKFLKLFYTCYI